MLIFKPKERKKIPMRLRRKLTFSIRNFFNPWKFKDKLDLSIPPIFTHTSLHSYLFFSNKNFPVGRVRHLVRWTKIDLRRVIGTGNFGGGCGPVPPITWDCLSSRDERSQSVLFPLRFKPAALGESKRINSKGIFVKKAEQIFNEENV